MFGSIIVNRREAIRQRRVYIFEEVLPPVHEELRAWVASIRGTGSAVRTEPIMDRLADLRRLAVLPGDADRVAAIRDAVIPAMEGDPFRGGREPTPADKQQAAPRQLEALEAAVGAADEYEAFLKAKLR